MTIKGISLIMAVIILSVYQLSRLDPSGALFSFISNNLLVNIGLIILSVVMVRLSFMKPKFSRKISYGAAAVGAVVFCLLGVASIVFPAVDFHAYSIFKPLDFMVLLEAGIVLSVCALTYEHQPIAINLHVPVLIRLPQPSLWRKRLEKRLAVWLPKPVLNHPHGSRTRAA